MCLSQLSERDSSKPKSAKRFNPESSAIIVIEDNQLLQSAKTKLQRMIPTVCHLDHLAPAGVCRVCSVELAREETDPKDPTRKVYRGSGKLVPACFQPVEDKMFVNTLAGADGSRVRRAAKSCTP